MFSGHGRCCRARPVCGELQRRRYAALLNAPANADMLITSLSYFSHLVEEVVETQVSEDYWKHLQSKLPKIERMWLDQTPAGR
jgi:hypothetical protein